MADRLPAEGTQKRGCSRLSGCEISLAFSDQASLDDVIGTGPSGPLGFGQGGLGGEPLGDDLIGCLAFQHTLPTGVVGGIEAAQELFELVMGVDGDGEPLRADAAIEALDHAIGLWRTRLDMAILCPEFGTDLGKGLGEAAAVVYQYMCHAEGKSVGSLAQESDGTGFGFVVLDGKMDRARTAVDGDVEIALAPLAIGGLQLRRSSPRFQPRSGWNGCGGRCLMSMCTKPRS